MKLVKRALSMILAGVFAASMCILPALADEAKPTSAIVEDPTYTVNVSGGNQGKISIDGGGEFSDSYSVKVRAGEPFEALIYIKVQNDKYYVKGIRDASVNNAYMNDYVISNDKVSENNEYALPVNLDITEDTNLVVAYGIKGELVKYTVEYKYGDTVLGSETFQAQLGDRPAPIAKYFDGYIPEVMKYSSIPALVGDSNKDRITFNYYKLPPNYHVIYEGETIRIITPEGAEVVVNPVTPEEAEAAGGVVPIVDADGETILDEDGNPLAAPIAEENLEDDANPLASANGEAGISTQAQDAASILSWLLPLLAAIVIAGLIMFFALLIRSKRKDDKKSAQ